MYNPTYKHYSSAFASGWHGPVSAYLPALTLNTNKLKRNIGSRIPVGMIPGGGPKKENFIELMTSDRELTASREGSKWRIYELQRRLQHWSKLTVLVQKVNLHHRAYCPSGRWRSNPFGKFSQEQLTRGTGTSTMRRAAHPSGCARCGAGAVCSAMKCQSLPLQNAKN